MPPRARFALIAITLSILFYLAAYRVAVSLGLPWNVGFLVPVLAVMLAAQGVRWSRKLLFVAGTVGAVVAFELLAAVTGLAGAANRATTVPELTAVAISYAAGHIIPLGALVLFVGRQPSVLWDAPQAASGQATAVKKRRR